MADIFSNFAEGLSTPATSAVAVTPNDTTLLSTTKGLYIGTTGDVVVTMADTSLVTFSTVPAGVILPIRVIHVMAATTAGNIVALT